MAGQRPCDPQWLLAKFRELDVFPPGFALQCPVRFAPSKGFPFVLPAI
jgi:hypothetical protein